MSGACRAFNNATCVQQADHGRGFECHVDVHVPLPTPPASHLPGRLCYRRWPHCTPSQTAVHASHSAPSARLLPRPRFVPPLPPLPTHEGGWRRRGRHGLMKPARARVYHCSLYSNMGEGCRCVISTIQPSLPGRQHACMPHLTATRGIRVSVANPQLVTGACTHQLTPTVLVEPGIEWHAFWEKGGGATHGGAREGRGVARGGAHPPVSCSRLCSAAPAPRPRPS